MSPPTRTAPPGPTLSVPVPPETGKPGGEIIPPPTTSIPVVVQEEPEPETVTALPVNAPMLNPDAIAPMVLVTTPPLAMVSEPGEPPPTVSTSVLVHREPEPVTVTVAEAPAIPKLAFPMVPPLV